MGYALSKEQVRYSGMPAECLKNCETDENRRPVMILYQSKPAGFRDSKRRVRGEYGELLVLEKAVGPAAHL